MNKKQARKLGKGMLLGKEDPAFSLNHCFLRRSLEVLKLYHEKPPVAFGLDSRALFGQKSRTINSSPPNSSLSQRIRDPTPAFRATLKERL